MKVTQPILYVLTYLDSDSLYKNGLYHPSFPPLLGAQAKGCLKSELYLSRTFPSLVIELPNNMPEVSILAGL